MRKRNTLSGFTLIELLVVISIIGILSYGISNINFSRLSQRQQIYIETTQIVNLIEEARNNALIGKGVDSSLTTPDSWSVEVNTSSNGSVIVNYAGGTPDYARYDSSFPFSIREIGCLKLNDDISSTQSNIILTFTGSTGGISGCSNDNDKKININYGNEIFSKNIIINTLSGIIEVD